MTAVGLGQQGSQAVGSVLESLACQKIYDPEISEILRGSLRKLSALSEKLFSTENHDTPRPPPFLSIVLFATGNFPKHSTEGFPCKVFRCCETNKNRRKIVT